MKHLRLLTHAALAALIAFGLPACDTTDDDDGAAPRYVPTEADRARCAHVDRDAELGESFYNTCLVNPWPTELPEVEVGGEPVLAAWINDTLAFVADDPQRPQRFNIQVNEQTNDGNPTGNMVVRGIRANYESIDTARIELSLIISTDTTIRSNTHFTISGLGSLNGSYLLSRENTSTLALSFEEEYIQGTFDLNLAEEQTGQELTLTDGRFHAYFGQ